VRITASDELIIILVETGAPAEVWDRAVQPLLQPPRLPGPQLAPPAEGRSALAGDMAEMVAIISELEDRASQGSSSTNRTVSGIKSNNWVYFKAVCQVVW
jgi:hypothetical protein